MPHASMKYLLLDVCKLKLILCYVVTPSMMGFISCKRNFTTYEFESDYKWLLVENTMPDRVKKHSCSLRKNT